MRYLFIVVLMLVCFRGLAQEYEAGLRLGEPYGFTLKTPINQSYSAEVIIGRGSPNSTQYYSRAFDNNRPVSSAIYDGQQVSGAFSAQVRMAYEESLNGEFDISEGNLVGYAGAGIQLRSVAVTYFYHTPNAGEAGAGRRESRSNVDIGPEGFIGFSYYFENLPLGVFAELGLFMEVMNRLGHFKVQGAIGARYLLGQ